MKNLEDSKINIEKLKKQIDETVGIFTLTTD